MDPVAWLRDHWLALVLVLGAFACAYGGYLIEKERQDLVDRMNDR